MLHLDSNRGMFACTLFLVIRTSGCHILPISIDKIDLLTSTRQDINSRDFYNMLPPIR